MQFREVCSIVVSYAPYILLQSFTITNLATLRVTIFLFFFTLGPSLVHILPLKITYNRIAYLELVLTALTLKCGTYTI